MADLHRDLQIVQLHAGHDGPSSNLGLVGGYRHHLFGPTPPWLGDLQFKVSQRWYFLTIQNPFYIS